MMLRLLWLFAVVTAGWQSHAAKLNKNQCKNDLCDRVDQLLKSSLNHTIDPCDDFRMYVCGSINNTRSSPPKNPVEDEFNELNSMKKNNDAAIFTDILEGKLSSDINIKSLEIERQIFRSCMTYGLRTEKDKNYYFDTLPEQARHLDHLDVHHPSTEHWRGSDRNYAYKGYGYAFFDLKIVDDPNGQRKRYIQISPPTDAWKVRVLLAKRYESKKYNSDELQELIGFSHGLIRISQSRGQKEEVKPIHITKWQSKWNDRIDRYTHMTAMIDWKDLIKKLFAALGETAPNSDVEILVNEKKYFFDLIELLKSSSMNTIENYVNLRYISKTIGLVDEEYFEYSMVPSISKLLCTPGLFVGTAHAYAKKYFPEENRNKLKEVFEAVRTSVKTHLGSISSNLVGNSDTTKAFLSKLENADVMYGYPAWLLDEDLVSDFYYRMTVNERYFNNEDYVYQSVLNHNLKAYHDPSLPLINIDQLFKAFTSDRIEIFEKHTNEIVIPVHAFSEANFNFFSAHLYDPMNYGSVAAILATNIYEKWFASLPDINNVTDCMRNYLPRNLTESQMRYFKIRATSYLLGLRTAYEVWPNKNSYQIEFENFGTIQDSRLFFLSFAETLCTRQGLPEINIFDTEIIPSTFINAVLSNMKEFQESFLCEDKDNMCGKQKCNPLEH